jgi:hypothetical protein
MPTIAIARVLHEGNSFSPILTPLANFTGHEWHIGPAAHAAYRGTNTELGGAIAWLDANPDWQPSFLRCAGAPSSGVLAPGVFDAIVEGITAGLAGRRFDAVFLSLHGSLNASEYPPSTGRNFDEVPRVIDALQTTDRTRAATPVNWRPGQKGIIPPSISDEQAKLLFPQGWDARKPYLRTVELPVP